eukprot:11256766-Alexandrium_andersonii.AAC.1
MSASLVGSEMCIRDSCVAVCLAAAASCCANGGVGRRQRQQVVAPAATATPGPDTSESRPPAAGG